MDGSEQHPILVAVDFSPDSQAAFLYASRAAQAYGAPLVVVHIVHDPESAPGYYSRKDASGRLVPMREAADEMFDEFLESMSAHPKAVKGLETTKRTVAGLPASRILEIAAEIGAQQIVVGSRGRTGLDHLLLGSKAERVAQLSSIPVTIVKRDYMER